MHVCVFKHSFSHEPVLNSNSITFEARSGNPVFSEEEGGIQKSPRKNSPGCKNVVVVEEVPPSPPQQTWKKKGRKIFAPIPLSLNIFLRGGEKRSGHSIIFGERGGEEGGGGQKFYGPRNMAA